MAVKLSSASWAIKAICLFVKQISDLPIQEPTLAKGCSLCSRRVSAVAEDDLELSSPAFTSLALGL